MVLEEVISKSQTILVGGEPRGGKLLFTLYSLSKLLQGPKTLFLTPIQELLMKKRFEGIKEVGDGVVNRYLQSTELFITYYFKDNFDQLKKRYPVDFLVKDIISAVEREGAEVLFFHRLEQFFEIQDFDNAEKFLKEITKYAQLNNKKLFFTFSHSEKYVNLQELLDNYIDLGIELKHGDERRIVEVKYTIFPMAEKRYFFQMTDRGLVLIPENIEKVESIRRFTTLVYSSDPKIRDILSYLLSNPRFKLKVTEKITDFMNALFKGFDIVFFFDADKDFDMDYCYLIKDNHLSTRLLYILNKDFIRSGDRVEAIDAGCYELFPKNFLIEDLVLALKRIVGDEFYNIHELDKLPHHFRNNKDNFCKIVKTFLARRIYFTNVVAKINLPMEKVVKVIRRSDFLYFDEKTKTYVFLFLNARQEITKDIILPNLQKRLGVPVEVEGIWDAISLDHTDFCDKL
ncbi:MAG: hypothetical protein C6I01_02160 [Epsilonproteobacteria bacterium]|jgi:hypothetical protein|nr:hypothetical protein [Campylobacterota bacterium]NPA89414.1 hypothetical protein [Campylobacterota bacterium]